MDYRVDVYWCPLCQDARRAMFRVVEGNDWPMHLHHFIENVNARPVMREVGWTDDPAHPHCMACKSPVELWPEAVAACALAPGEMSGRTIAELVEARRRAE